MIARTPQLAVLAAVLALAGCGSSDEPEGERLPASVTVELNRQLDAISDRVAVEIPGACDDIYKDADDDGNIEPIEAAVASIPDDVDPQIRSALEQSIERLRQLVDERCSEIRAAAEAQTQTETEPEPTLTEETTTVETETVPTQTETSPEVDPEAKRTKPEPTPEPDPPSPPGQGPGEFQPPGQEEGGIRAPSGGDE